MLITKLAVFIQFQVVTVACIPVERKIKRGRRLMKKAVLTAVFTFTSAQFGAKGLGEREVKTGYNRRAKIRRRLDVKVKEYICIVPTWICTKNFWFLRPTDDCSPLGARGKRARSSTEKKNLAGFCSCVPLSASKGILTPIVSTTS